ncbi:abortive infection family protein [Duganella fentianensis]|uniref:abortive infection family protein n=1 Tax=Duganella fentianensis TaxID=2692177 RepID=UPI0032B1E671
MPAPLSDAILFAVASLVDDAQSEDRRDPTHSQIDFIVGRASLTAGDPKAHGQTVGKAKRIRAVLSWALANNRPQGEALVESLISFLRAAGGFRPDSSNYVGTEPIKNAVNAFRAEGFILSSDGELHPLVLDNLTGVQMTEALKRYIRRAQHGNEDAALITGTAKDLLEATAAHVLVERTGLYPTGANFEALLGMAFVAVGMVTAAHPVQPSEPWKCKIERGQFTLALGINGMRNKQGTGHGRPWLPTVTDVQAKNAVRSMANIAEWLLHAHEQTP